MKKGIDRTIQKYALIMLSGILWGTIGLFVKVLDAKGSTSEYTTFMRMFFAFLLLLAITLIKEGTAAFRIGKRTMLSCALLGFVSMSLNNLCYTNAVNRLGMSLAAAILYMAPIFTSIQSKLIFHEKIGKNKMTALALNVLGCGLAATGGKLSLEGLSVIGLMFGIGAAFAYSTQNIFGRLATDEASPFVVATYNFFFAAVFTLAVARPFSGMSDPFDPQILMWGLFFGLIPTTIAYLLYFAGIQGLKETSKVPVFCSLELVVATMLGGLLFNEDLPPASLLGTAMILVSIMLMNRRTADKTQDRDAA
ncbi:MAG: EamA family transporter [Mogibacterium sp.]|nr:EamA family transporter [Mogibacterium sp.]